MGNDRGCTDESFGPVGGDKSENPGREKTPVHFVCRYNDTSRTELLPFLDFPTGAGSRLQWLNSVEKTDVPVIYHCSLFTINKTHVDKTYKGPSTTDSCFIVGYVLIV